MCPVQDRQQTGVRGVNSRSSGWGMLGQLLDEQDLALLARVVPVLLDDRMPRDRLAGSWRAFWSARERLVQLKDAQPGRAHQVDLVHYLACRHDLLNQLPR